MEECQAHLLACYRLSWHALSLLPVGRVQPLLQGSQAHPINLILVDVMDARFAVGWRHRTEPVLNLFLARAACQ